MIWDLASPPFLIWVGQTRRVRPPGVFALYVAGYSGFRIFEETLRIDYSEHILGLRLNFFVALVLCLPRARLVRRDPDGLAWVRRTEDRARAGHDDAHLASSDDTAAAASSPCQAQREPQHGNCQNTFRWPRWLTRPRLLNAMQGAQAK